MWNVPSEPLNGKVGAPSWLTTTGVYAGGIENDGAWRGADVDEQAATVTTAPIPTTAPRTRCSLIVQD
ncbi:hypothetical protein GCM10010528_23070 [Gordonia defluvii]|uniref:Uncharacterized protein n=1 Tax=Gordonia defluvii TaxID=283718 RepID=A0ABP6LGK8_9ACTN